MCVDTEFLFKRSTWYRMSECSRWVRCKVEHEKRNSISTSSHVLFCLFCEHIGDDCLDDFQRISEKLSRKLSEGQTNVSEHFLKIFKDRQRLARKTWYFDHTPTNLSTIYIQVTKYQWNHLFPRKNWGCFNHIATHQSTF